jgi:hypothetical protein
MGGKFRDATVRSGESRNAYAAYSVSHKICLSFLGKRGRKA